MLEEWAWDADVLATFARNDQGETIPTDLVAAMRRADDFGKGYKRGTQMFYAAMSYGFHIREHDDLTARLQELKGRYSVFPYVGDTHLHVPSGTSTATAPATTRTCGRSSSPRTCSRLRPRRPVRPRGGRSVQGEGARSGRPSRRR